MKLIDLRSRFAEKAAPPDPTRTFEWKGSERSCATCLRTERNLNVNDQCVECFDGKIPLGMTPIPKSTPLSGQGLQALARWPKDVPKPPVKIESGGFPTALSTVRILKHTTDGHNKFYVIARYGRWLRTSWGKVGSVKGQDNLEGYHDDAFAKSHKKEVINEKIMKGYKDVTPK